MAIEYSINRRLPQLGTIAVQRIQLTRHTGSIEPN